MKTNRSNNYRALVLPLVLAGGLLACSDDGDTPGADSGPAPDFAAAQADVLVKVATYDSAGFTKINDAPVETQHGLGSHANVWVTTEHADLYRELDPSDTAATHAPFPAGMIIVKEHQDAAGVAVDGILVMSKFAPGFNDADADWWWAGFQSKTEVNENAVGVVGFCIACHKDTNNLARTDYMLGVETDNRL